MPKVVDYERRRREIAERAIPVFAREGFHDANLSRISALCGFGRTTIYKYFKDKDEIFLFVLDGIFERFESGARAVVEDRGSGAIAKLEALFGLMVRDSIDDRDRMLIVLDLILRLRRDERGMAAGVRLRLAALRRYFERALGEGMESGEIRRGDAAALASVLFSLVESFVLQRSFYEAFSYGAAMEATRTLIGGLRA